MGRKWGSISFEGLGTPVVQVVNCVPLPCNLLSAVMPDHVLGISCFRFYLSFIEVNKQLSSCVQSLLYSLYRMYCLYFYTVQTFIGVHTNLFSQPQQSHDKLDTHLQKNSRKEGRKTDGRRKDGRRTTDRLSPGGACFTLPQNTNMLKFWSFLGGTCTKMPFEMFSPCILYT